MALAFDNSISLYINYISLDSWDGPDLQSSNVYIALTISHTLTEKQVPLSIKRIVPVSKNQED